jgi:hypothetical protein
MLSGAPKKFKTAHYRGVSYLGRRPHLLGGYPFKIAFVVQAVAV